MKGFLRCILPVFLLAGCQAAPRGDAPKQTSIANPASTHCIEVGGGLMIKRRGDGGEYGVCGFKGGRQCEEWALFRGECPMGGVGIAGLAPGAPQYCAITGGKYVASQGQGAGVCVLKSGRSCDAEDYFLGKCHE